MASGILGQVSLATTAFTTLYTVPSSTVGYVNFNMVNTNTTNVTVRVAISATATPAASEYIEYDTIIPGNGVLERTGFVMNSSRNLVVRTNVTGVSVSAYGVEESA
jgi:hypothetical protein